MAVTKENTIYSIVTIFNGNSGAIDAAELTYKCNSTNKLPGVCDVNGQICIL